ncbi:MAG: FAD-dependent thymidylate synthase, partial [Candidatus Hodarchaeota archaeon]
MNNKVELLGYYGGDLTHAASAWTSTSRDITPEKRERIGSLLKMLADKQHFTPFEKSFLHFLVTCDIASHIHIIKHRIGVSANSESARYKELRDDKYYIPIDWPEQEQKEFENHIKKSYELYHQMINHLVY